jgi:hypothetical protein
MFILKSMLDAFETQFVVNGSASDAYKAIDSLEITDWRFKKKQSNPEDLSFVFSLKYEKGHLANFPPIDVKIEQIAANQSTVFLVFKANALIGGTSKHERKFNSLRSSAFTAFSSIIENACLELKVSADDVSQIDDVPALMAMTEASGSSDAATMRLIEIAKRHEESGNQVEALLILAPLASKYCIPAIDALTRISAEKGDMAGLQSWAAKKAEAQQIVSSGHGSAISGVSRSVLPQIAAMGFIATNMNLIGLKNEVNEMASEEPDSGWSDSFGDF